MTAPLAPCPFEDWWKANDGRFIDMNSMQGKQRHYEAKRAFFAAWNSRPSPSASADLVEVAAIELWREDARTAAPNVYKQRNSETWRDVSPDMQERYRRLARAVAPLIAAQDREDALEEALVSQTLEVAREAAAQARDGALERLREALHTAGPIHAGPVRGNLGRKYPAARECVIEFEKGEGAYDLMMVLSEIRATLKGADDA